MHIHIICTIEKWRARCLKNKPYTRIITLLFKWWLSPLFSLSLSDDIFLLPRKRTRERVKSLLRVKSTPAQDVRFKIVHSWKSSAYYKLILFCQCSLVIVFFFFFNRKITVCIRTTSGRLKVYLTIFNAASSVQISFVYLTDP